MCKLYLSDKLINICSKDNDHCSNSCGNGCNHCSYTGHYFDNIEIDDAIEYDKYIEEQTKKIMEEEELKFQKFNSIKSIYLNSNISELLKNNIVKIISKNSSNYRLEINLIITTIWIKVYVEEDNIIESIQFDS
jgi:hypothetical protein